MVSDIVSGGKRMVMMPYNETWRKIRKLMHQVRNNFVNRVNDQDTHVKRSGSISTNYGERKRPASLGVLYQTQGMVFAQWTILQQVCRYGSWLMAA
jgi:hypothetical protein